MEQSYTTELPSDTSFDDVIRPVMGGGGSVPQSYHTPPQSQESLRTPKEESETTSHMLELLFKRELIGCAEPLMKFEDCVETYASRTVIRGNTKLHKTYHRIFIRKNQN